MYEMKEDYLTGIDFIDAEHAKLFDIINKLYEIMKNEYVSDKYDYIIQVVNELKDYTQYHFSHEEEYMKSIHYKKLLSQIVEHRDFIEQLDSLDLATIDANQDQTIIDLLEFLNSWLVHHICESDKQIALPSK